MRSRQICAKVWLVLRSLTLERLQRLRFVTCIRWMHMFFWQANCNAAACKEQRGACKHSAMGIMSTYSCMPTERSSRASITAAGHAQKGKGRHKTIEEVN
eukprot:scaffold204474_cov17-Tisochrysis_lutea.AAC.1